jgi:hypothetical protein
MGETAKPAAEPVAGAGCGRCGGRMPTILGALAVVAAATLAAAGVARCQQPAPPPATPPAASSGPGAADAAPPGGGLGSFGGSEPASPIARFIEEQREQAGREVPPIEIAGPESLEGLDPETAREAREAFREYYRYRTTGFRHRRATFEWQLLSSKIIFTAVILLVFTGIYFAGVQFHATLRRPPPRVATEAAADAAEPTVAGLGGTIDAGPGSIKVSSPVLGVIILTLSLAFFYLYLVYVYPIQEIF